MGWHILQNKGKIKGIIERVLSKNIEINVRFEGTKVEYSSKIIEILPFSPEKVDGPEESKTFFKLAIEKLTPTSGNDLFQHSKEAWIEFPLKDHICRFQAKCEGISSEYPYYGFLISMPSFMELEEQRIDERINLETPALVSARFCLGNGEGEQSYELGVMNYSSKGIGLLVTNKEFDLLDVLNTGYKVSNVTIFAEGALARLDGTVQHMTRIERGTNQGKYILGLESNFPIDLSENDLERSRVTV